MVKNFYIDTIGKRFNAIQKQEKNFRRAASLVVECVLNGGTFWIYDREEALSWEANVKAAGLFITNNRYTTESILNQGDVLLIGAIEPDTSGDLAIAERAHSRNAKVIAVVSTSLIGRKPHGKFFAETADIVLDNYSPEVFGVLSVKGIAQPFCPATGVMNDCIFWALCAAIVDEFLLRDKSPTVYRGVHLFDGRKYNEKAAKRFNELGY